MKKWICTDIDNQQYGRKRTDLNTWAFEFKEKGVEKTIIDLEDYDIEKMQFYISCYGYSLNPASSYFIFDIYKNKEAVNWVIAECIFEQECGNY